MRVLGEVIAEARRKANLTQRQLAELIKTEEGRGISGPYLNDIEHSLRHPPRGFLLQQLAKVLNRDVDLLYFLAHQMPFDIDVSDVPEERTLTLTSERLIAHRAPFAQADHEIKLTLYSVASAIPCRRHTSAVFSPASTSRRIPMICSSLNRLPFICPSPLGDELYCNPRGFSGGTPTVIGCLVL